MDLYITWHQPGVRDVKQWWEGNPRSSKSSKDIRLCHWLLAVCWAANLCAKHFSTAQAFVGAFTWIFLSATSSPQGWSTTLSRSRRQLWWRIACWTNLVSQGKSAACTCRLQEQNVTVLENCLAAWDLRIEIQDSSRFPITYCLDCNMMRKQINCWICWILLCGEFPMFVPRDAWKRQCAVDSDERKEQSHNKGKVKWPDATPGMQPDSWTQCLWKQTSRGQLNRLFPFLDFFLGPLNAPLHLRHVCCNPKMQHTEGFVQSSSQVLTISKTKTEIPENIPNMPSSKVL